jgi:hypothetical protein
MGNYSVFEQEDLIEFSGPHVWPKTTVWSIVDRYIHRRPELAYRKAVRKIKETTIEQDDMPKITITIRSNLKGKTDTMGRFNHYFNEEESDVEDVRRFLQELRLILERLMPDNQCLDCSCILFFKQGTQYLTSFQEAWI